MNGEFVLGVDDQKIREIKNKLNVKYPGQMVNLGIIAGYFLPSVDSRLYMGPKFWYFEFNDAMQMLDFQMRYL